MLHKRLKLAGKVFLLLAVLSLLAWSCFTRSGYDMSPGTTKAEWYKQRLKDKARSASINMRFSFVFGACLGAGVSLLAAGFLVGRQSQHTHQA